MPSPFACSTIFRIPNAPHTNTRHTNTHHPHIRTTHLTHISHPLLLLSHPTSEAYGSRNAVTDHHPIHACAASDRNECYPENAASDDFFFVAVWKVASDLALRCILGFMLLLEVFSLPCPPGSRDAIAKGLKTGYMNSVYYRLSLSVRCALPCVDSPHLPYLHSTHPIDVWGHPSLLAQMFSHVTRVRSFPRPVQDRCLGYPNIALNVEPKSLLVSAIACSTP